MITFEKLWNSYPTINGEKAPCQTNGVKNFSDQCAIRLGVALASCGVVTSKLVPTKRHCWQHQANEGHILAAEELANGLMKANIPGIGALLKINPDTFQNDLSGKKGIIFFKDFWARKGEEFDQRSGDHIDLWNLNRMSDWRTWFFISSTFNTGGSYSKSKAVWFWEIK